MTATMFDATPSDGTHIDVAAPTDLSPCPPWCRHLADLPDHGYESITNESQWKFTRYHVSAAHSPVHLCQQEYRDMDGAVTYGPVEIVAWIAGSDMIVLSEAQAREAAAQLLAVADKMRALTEARPEQMPR